MSGAESDKHIALNEACITNTEFSRMITLSIEVNGAYINTVKADGIIIATPTGSTAYNLSAGGPILNPDTRLITLTYICPHTLTSRPLVLAGEDEIAIKVDSRYNNIQVSCDGQKSLSLNSGDTVVIRRSRLVTRIIKTSNMNFYDILRHKMVDVGL
jgi:NAD+ kinase